MKSTNIKRYILNYFFNFTTNFKTYNMNLKIISVFTLLLLLNSCKQEKNKDMGKHPYFDTTGMDLSTKPGDNFFNYANGGWLKAAKIPDDQSGWGSFYTLYQENLDKLKTILDESATNKSEKGSIEQKVGDYYASGMDTLTIEKIGSDPLKPMLNKIDAITDYKSFINLITESFSKGEGYLIGFYVSADEKNSAMNIGCLYQTGTSLPEKDYYTRQDSSSKACRKALLTYAEKLFSLVGMNKENAVEQSNNLLLLETEIAKSHRGAVALRDPQSNYNKMSVKQLENLSPNLNWSNFFKELKIKPDSLVIGQPEYYKSLSELISSKPINQWKTKLKFDYLSSNASLLSKEFQNANFEFEKVFSGQKTKSKRWKKMVKVVDNGLGDLLGQLYVKKHFNDTAKKKMDELVNNLQKAFNLRIQNLDWMSDATKINATKKLNSFLKKIGYPSVWKNFDDVIINRNDFFGNSKAVSLHEQKVMLAKIGNPVDRMEWGMTAPTVNAYYNPTNNEIVFPAGILQFPFFDANADDAINYGGIGMVIGHEMTHGFDDQGCQYDEKGNMKNWWTKEDNEKFKSKTGGVVSQYNKFTVLNSLHVNGELTLGENLADIGGLAIAFDAFKMTTQSKDTTKIDGFTPNQRFFLGYAQVWRMKNRDETLRTRINTDPHSPEMFRVNGPAYNFTPFYEAFNIKVDAKQYIKPENRAKIW